MFKFIKFNLNDDLIERERYGCWGESFNVVSHLTLQLLRPHSIHLSKNEIKNTSINDSQWETEERGKFMGEFMGDKLTFY